MNRNNFGPAALLCLVASPLYAAPILNVEPGGVQAGNFIWDVSITPDLDIAGGSTPMALELGFRLTGAPLLSATNINPAEFDTPNPGQVIFGWLCGLYSAHFTSFAAAISFSDSCAVGTSSSTSSPRASSDE